VIELASMLAGEPFSDRPKSVCRVIASFLRAYNDAVDDKRRQDLYRCAAQVVGTRGSWATARARISRCEHEFAEVRGYAFPKPLRWLAHGLRCVDPSDNLTGFLASLARTLSTSDSGHERALALVDDLVGIAVRPAPPRRPMSGVPDAAVRLHQSMGS
jgi:hypothetical protein